MNVSVAYAGKTNQEWFEVDVPEESTVEDVIKLSGLLERFPEIDLENQKIGIFGKQTKLNKKVEAGNRIEVYRPITADPELAERHD